MPRKKLIRFEQNAIAANVIERGKENYQTIKSSWSSYFGNNNPIVLELACGRGEYTVGLAARFPYHNFIGVDIKGDRIARGSQAAMEKGLKNVAFLRTGIQYLEEFFDKDSINEIWIIHPDPRMLDKDDHRRLTGTSFLSLYSKLLKPGSKLFLKTDSAFLYGFSLSNINHHPDFKLVGHTAELYRSKYNELNFGIETHYEKLFRDKGHLITFIEAERL